MGDPWRPTKTRQEMLSRSVQSMVPGTMQGRVSQARPVTRVSAARQQDQLEPEEEDVEREIYFAKDQVLAAADGALEFGLSHVPDEDSLHLYVNGVEIDEEDGYGLDLNLVQISESAGIRESDLLTARYAYDKNGPAGKQIVLIPWSSAGWKYLPDIPDGIDRSAPDFDDSAWPTGSMRFSWTSGQSLRLWARKTFPAASQAVLHIDVEDHANVYVNGFKVIALPYKGPGIANDDRTIDYPIPAWALNDDGVNLLAVEAIDDEASVSGLDLELRGVPK